MVLTNCVYDGNSFTAVIECAVRGYTESKEIVEKTLLETKYMEN